MSDETTTKNTNGNKQREKIPRTTQVKRMYKHAFKNVKGETPSLKAWARESNDPLVKEWLEYKALT